MGREHGVTTRHLEELAAYRDSSAFSDEERLVVDLAVEMAKTPVAVPLDLMAELHRRFDEAQLVELVASIAWENYRARFNRPFGIEAVGFSAGAVCAIPESRVQSAPGPA
ncbi:MAG: carboxymuconolactone decarboxylase family protein [Streptosporangiaceae bacterium]